MKKLSILLVVVVLMTMVFTSCETVKPGHKGVEVSWGGETNMQTIYSEGMDGGFHWLFDEMIQYDVREKTLVQKFEFNDKNNMVTGVELSVDYNLSPTKVNVLHVGITDIDQKIIKTIKSAGKEVIPQYSAVELNITKRTEAESKLERILTEEFPEFYVDFKRIQMTDVDIPAAVAKLATETAVQLGRNELATKKEAEQQALAKAKVALAQGNYNAAQLDVKTKELMSRPAVLKLYEAETERKWAEKGVSKYGHDNVFGASASVIKGLK